MSIFDSVVNAIAIGLRQRPGARAWCLALALGGLVVAGFVLVVGPAALDDRDLANRIALLVAAPSALGVMAAADAFVDRNVTSPGDDLDVILAERREIRAQYASSEKRDVFASLDLNLNQLAEFYSMSRAQARSSFRLGVSASFTGLMALVVSVGVLISRKQGMTTSAFVTAVGGALGQFVAVSCFALYRHAVRQVNLFFGQLSRVQQAMLAVSLAEQIKDKSARDLALRDVINSLLPRTTVADAAPRTPG